METNPVANANLHDGVSSPEVVPAPMGAAAGQADESTSSANTSFIGPLGPPDATSSAGNAAVVDNARDAAAADDDDDDDDVDAMMDDLAEVELHVPLHMGDEGSESDDDDDESLPKNGKEAPSEMVTARAPSLTNGWDDHAVTSCFDRAIQMHSMTAEEILAADEVSGGWEAGPNVVPPNRYDALDRPKTKKNGVGSTATESAETTTSAKQPKQTLCEGAKIEVTTSISDPFVGDNGNNGDGDQENPWRPRPLPLPTWAVDPVYAAAETTMS